MLPIEVCVSCESLWMCAQIAFSVEVELTVTAEVYLVDARLGVEPSSVYAAVWPEPQVMVTLWGAVKDPPDGEKVGAWAKANCTHSNSRHTSAPRRRSVFIWKDVL